MKLRLVLVIAFLPSVGCEWNGSAAERTNGLDNCPPGTDSIPSGSTDQLAAVLESRPGTFLQVIPGTATHKKKDNSSATKTRRHKEAI
jgi:hypothetical protein